MWDAQSSKETKEDQLLSTMPSERDQQIQPMSQIKSLQSLFFKISATLLCLQIDP